MNITIVEDYVLIREVIARVCRTLCREGCLSEATSGSEAVDVIRNNRPELVILDIHLVDIDGFEVLERVRAGGLNPLVLIHSGYVNPCMVYRVEHANVQGFIDKQSQDLTSIRTSIAAIGRHKTPFSPAYVNARASMRRDPNSFDKLLTEKQVSILSMVAHQYDDGTIGRIHCITERTVENHRTTIMRKLGVHSRTELIRYANQQGFLTCGIFLSGCEEPGPMTDTQSAA